MPGTRSRRSVCGPLHRRPVKDGIHGKRYEGKPVISKYCDTNQNVLHDAKLKKYVGFSRFGFGRRLASLSS